MGQLGCKHVQSISFLCPCLFKAEEEQDDSRQECLLMAGKTAATRCGYTVNSKLPECGCDWPLSVGIFFFLLFFPQRMDVLRQDKSY